MQYFLINYFLIRLSEIKTLKIFYFHLAGQGFLNFKIFKNKKLFKSFSFSLKRENSLNLENFGKALKALRAENLAKSAL